ncbi:MAG: hypothetical protein ACOX50_03590 [Patescibacteria group bacterium]|jgi:hypothetical protein
MDQIVALTKGREFKTAQGLEFPQIIASPEILEETKKKLLSFSKEDEFFEGVVYWVGKETPQGLLVTEVVVPKATVTPVSFRVTSFENARIITELVKKGLQLIAQVHSHPNRLGVEHNLFEEEMGFMPYDGLFSIVVANYAKDGLLPLVENTGIYIYSKNDFLRLTEEQINSCFKLSL